MNVSLVWTHPAAVSAPLARPLTLGLVAATMLLSAPANAAQPQCSPSERWNPDMQMCVLNKEAVPETIVGDPKSNQGPAAAPDAMPTPHATSSPTMDMTDRGKGGSPFMLQITE